MALSTYEQRMVERETMYPMSPHRPGEYDIRYTVAPYKDHIKHSPLLDIGEAREIPRHMTVPVIFLVDLFNPETNTFYGKKFETVYVLQDFMRTELMPNRFAIYATPEAYALLALPVVDHRIHDTIPKTDAEYRKVLQKRSWEEEKWKYTVEFLFRKYEQGPLELADVAEEWDGVEEIGASASGKGAGAEATGRKGPVKMRKARKVKLF
jgi:hypothetical protein